MKKTILSAALAFAFLAGAGDVCANPLSKFGNNDVTKQVMTALGTTSDADMLKVDEMFQALKKVANNKFVKDFAERGHDIAEAMHKKRGTNYFPDENKDFTTDVQRLPTAELQNAVAGMQGQVNEAIDIVKKYRSAASSIEGAGEFIKYYDLVLQAFARLNVTPAVAAPAVTAPVATPAVTAPVAAPAVTAPVVTPAVTAPVATPAVTTPVAAPAVTAPVAAPAPVQQASRRGRR